METGGGAQNTNWVRRKTYNYIPSPRARETKKYFNTEFTLGDSKITILYQLTVLSPPLPLSPRRGSGRW